MKRVLLAFGAALTLSACADYYGYDDPYYGYRYEGDYGRPYRSAPYYDGYRYRYRSYDDAPYYTPPPYRY